MRVSNFIKQLLMDAASDAAGGGSGGGGAGASGSASGGSGGSLLGGSAGGSGAAAGAAGAGAAGGEGGSGAAGGGSDWRTGIEKDILDDPSFKNVKDVPSLARSFVHGQRMIGADKVVIPGKHATDADWATFYQKAGLPADPKDYNPEMPKDFEFDDKFMGDFKDNAYKLGILPKQASALLGWYAGMTKGAIGQSQELLAAKQKEGVDALRQEWGQGFDKQVGLANLGLKEFGGEDADKLTQALNRAGLGSEPVVMKFLARLGESVKEDGIKGGGQEALNGRLTPDDARAKYTDIMGDAKGPYFDATHPGHAAAVKEVARLMDAMHQG